MIVIIKATPNTMPQLQGYEAGTGRDSRKQPENHVVLV